VQLEPEPHFPNARQAFLSTDNQIALSDASPSVMGMSHFMRTFNEVASKEANHDHFL